jgi:hypothetical protein
LFGLTLDLANDLVGMQVFDLLATFDRPLYARDRVLSQQLQNPDVLASAGWCAVALFQLLPHAGKHGWQAPVAIHVRVIQRSRPSP